MKKPLLSRIFGLAVLYCVVFFFLVILQFSNKGNFTLTAGAMTIKGRYLDSTGSYQSAGNPVTGGVKIFFGGIEFNLKEDNGKGLLLTGAHGQTAVNPGFLTISDNSARLGLPGGTAIFFSSFDSARGPELQISAEFADNIREASITITPRRSSLVRENGQLGILYNGSRYLFGGSGEELESGKLVLSSENTFASYRSRGKQKEFNPSDYIIAQSQNYESVITDWQNSSYAYWNQNANSLYNANDIAAYCAEALRRGQYTAAVRSIPPSFLTSPQNSYISSGFAGGMTAAFNSFTSEEQEKANLIFRLTRNQSPDVFKEEHLLDFLLTRSNTALANDVIDLIQNVESEKLSAEHCPGLLEIYSDYKLWRPALANPVEPLAERILSLISENLNHDAEKDLVNVTHTEKTDLASLRLGKALIGWADDINKAEWEAIGRSLVLSALVNGGAGNGELYNALSPGDYFPRASLLADNGLWTWTVSPSTRAYYIDGNLNISFSFPTNMAHYVIICGVRPFIKLQIHETDWRSDSQFEIYDSSGWVYYPQNQILVLKLKHRASVESIRVFYRVEEPPPPVIIEENTADNDTEGYVYNFEP